MFKSLNLLIHKAPWWGLLLGGIVTLLTLLLFAAPFKVLRLSDHAATPQEKSAVQHEINQAFKDGGLSVAEGIVSAMKERAQDPSRRRELDRALAEIERARNAVSSTEHEVAQTVHEAAIEALNAAQEAAQVAVEAAQEARETIEESRDEALQRLRAKGLDVSATGKSFDDLLKGAKEKETAAQLALDGIATSRERLQQAAPAQHGQTVDITVASSPVSRSHFKFEATPSAPTQPLPPEVRDSIRAAVAGDMWRAGIGSALILAFIPLFVMLLIAKFFIDRSHRAMAFAERKGEEAQVSDMRRQMTEARLQALQAQVEPHFLYNTLANVQALTEVDPPTANRLVGHLIEYLRAALPKMRESSSTVGQEVERVRAYLNILKIRMGERLNFDIHVSEDLLALPFPPMMLPSLVENAIKHGLEPRREGGRIDVLVTRSLRNGQARLMLQVRDTGAGLSERGAPSGGGLGLSNLRERLAALYGEQARFSLEANEPQGAVATLDIPLDWQAGGSGHPAAPSPGLDVQARPARRGWRRVWGVTRKTHGLWATLVARTFMVLMSLLVVAFFVGLVGVFTGWLPVQINNFELNGLEGMALGSLGLLIAFGALALVIGIMVVIMYGMGFLFASLLLFVPAVVLIGLFPVYSPFVLIGLGIYWFWWKKRKNRRMSDLKKRP
jgi:hypothetical protein